MSGKIELHRRLTLNDRTGEPRLRIVSTCTNLIRTLPTLPLSKTNSEDVDTKAEDHAYDALRYMCMTRQTGLPHAGMLNKVKEQTYEPINQIFGY